MTDSEAAQATYWAIIELMGNSEVARLRAIEAAAKEWRRQVRQDDDDALVTLGWRMPINEKHLALIDAILAGKGPAGEEG
jgi:hypothetical protein